MAKKTATATGTMRDARATGAVVPKGTAGVDRLLDMHEAAGALAISHGTVKALVASGRLASLKLGRRRLIRRSDLAKFISNL
ncbi:MAG: helix-turn-helix domain-containing protein [Actinomycetota bacterium]|nr:helix-turn-helix domain-containing protein [Actinomycetota bacterium]